MLFTLSLTILFATLVSFSPLLVSAENNLESPTDLQANVISSTHVDLSWNAQDNDSSIIGYKIEHRVNTNTDYNVVVENPDSIDTVYSDTDLSPDTIYAYRVYAINSAGYSEPSSSVTVKTNSDTNQSTTNEPLSDVPTNVVAKAISATSIELSWNPPTQTYGQTIQGYIIKQEIASDVYDEIASAASSSTSQLISNLESDTTYTFVVVANYALGSSDISQEYTVTLNSSADNNNSSTTPDDVPDRPTNLDKSGNEVNHETSSVVDNNPKQNSIDAFSNIFDESKGSQHYIDRYNNESAYKEWFDTNFPEYSSIYQAVGLSESIHDNPENEQSKSPKCGSGTELVDGMCVLVEKPKVKPWWQFW